MRIKVDRFSIPNGRNPLLFLVFAFFLTVSCDLLQIQALFFRVKLNNILGFALVFSYFLLYKRVFLDKNLLVSSLFCFGSLFISTIFGYNFIACSGFLLFFLFNYLIYFVFPANLFRVFESEFLWRIYFISFCCVGVYALLQVLFSIGKIYLPGVHQYINGLARGQALCYEPSYYALYMTPFSIYQTVVCVLEKKRFMTLLLSNGLLLISTSTGCFFSYLILLICFCLFRFEGLSKKKLILSALSFFLVLFFTVWLFQPDLIKFGLLKFFYDSGFTQHHSVLERWSMIQEYWCVFLNNPWIGTGLGGTTAFILSQISDEPVDLWQADILNQHIASNVTTEMMASVGLLGCLAFGTLLYSLGKTFYNVFAISALSKNERIQMIALAISLCVTFFTLQFSQSIMRPYIWLHVGMSVGFAKHLQRKYAYSRAAG